MKRGHAGLGSLPPFGPDTLRGGESLHSKTVSFLEPAAFIVANMCLCEPASLARHKTGLEACVSPFSQNESHGTET